MNHDAAIRLIDETFDRPFDEGRFAHLVSNLLNEIDRSKATGFRSGNIIPQAFRGRISTYRRLFVYTDPQVTALMAEGR